MDPRLRRAVDASIGWYEDILALHGIGSRLEDGLWSSAGPPPPLHSDAITAEPSVSAEQVVARLAGRQRWGVKDSFAEIDLSGAGLDVLFSATWIHREPPALASTAWERVTDEGRLAAWNAGWDTTDVLVPAILQRGHIAVLARSGDGGIEAGAVARLASGVVELSNVHGVDGHEVDWDELVAAIGTRFPGRPLVGYERGDDLGAALGAGFEAVGELRVWSGA
jgi:hypothetical protein